MTVTDNGTPPLSGMVTIMITVTPAPVPPVVVAGVVSKGPLAGVTITIFPLTPEGQRGMPVAPHRG